MDIVSSSSESSEEGSIEPIQKTLGRYKYFLACIFAGTPFDHMKPGDELDTLVENVRYRAALHVYGNDDAKLSHHELTQDILEMSREAVGHTIEKLGASVFSYPIGEIWEQFFADNPTRNGIILRQETVLAPRREDISYGFDFVTQGLRLPPQKFTAGRENTHPLKFTVGTQFTTARHASDIRKKREKLLANNPRLQSTKKKGTHLAHPHALCLYSFLHDDFTSISTDEYSAKYGRKNPKKQEINPFHDILEHSAQQGIHPVDAIHATPNSAYFMPELQHALLLSNLLYRVGAQEFIDGNYEFITLKNAGMHRRFNEPYHDWVSYRSHFARFRFACEFAKAG